MPTSRLVQLLRTLRAKLSSSAWNMMLPYCRGMRTGQPGLVYFFKFLGAKLFPSGWNPFFLLRRLVSNAMGLHHWRWMPKNFSNPNFERLNEGELVEEENLESGEVKRYYPVRIGEVIASRYQIVGKLGYGVSATAWLARDLKECRHVSLKICIRASALESRDLQKELAAYRRLEHGPKDHPGRQGIRLLLDEFKIIGPHGEHQCFVHPPLWGNLSSFLRHGDLRLSPPVLALMLKHLFLALDYAQKCQVIHTDISSNNIMLTLTDSTSLEKYEQFELENPSPRKEIDGRFVYRSRDLEYPDNAYGFPVICDFGHSVWGGEKHNGDAQPDVYRSPEVILAVPWSYEVDIWSIACMTWDMLESRGLFNGIDNEHRTYRGRVHLAEMVAIMGPPPREFLAQGALSSCFFLPDGEPIFRVPSRTLEGVETALWWAPNPDDQGRNLFLRFMRKMLQWDPKKRQTPMQLLEDEWINRQISGLRQI